MVWLSVRDPGSFTNLLSEYWLDSEVVRNPVLCFINIGSLSRWWNGSGCQSEIDQALEIEHDGGQEGLDTDLG